MKPKLKWWRDSIKIKAQKIVREMMEEQKQKEVVKQKELQGLLNRYGATLEDTKEQKQHLREENERLKQELRAVKIQLSKKHGRCSTHWELRDKVGLQRLTLSLCRRL